MTSRIILPLLLVLLAIPAATVHAQSATQTPDQSQSDAATDAEVAANDDEDADEDTTGTDADDAAEEEDATARFIPTEQVSQDLGVSFPVDI